MTISPASVSGTARGCCGGVPTKRPSSARSIKSEKNEADDAARLMAAPGQIIDARLHSICSQFMRFHL
jgi:hypothetical protein